MYDTAFLPLAGATVTVITEGGVGASTVSDNLGAFSLSGKFSNADVYRASKDGYVEQTKPMAPDLYFVLRPLTPPVDMTGNYSLTLIADEECSQLPPVARSRTYTATITSYGIVGNGTFLAGWHEFMVNIAGNIVNFGFDLDGNPELVEQVGETAYLAYRGSAVTSIATGATTIAAPFDGTIGYCDTGVAMGANYSCKPRLPTQFAQCTSRNHRLILTRR